MLSVDEPVRVGQRARRCESVAQMLCRLESTVAEAAFAPTKRPIGWTWLQEFVYLDAAASVADANKLQDV